MSFPLVCPAPGYCILNVRGIPLGYHKQRLKAKRRLDPNRDSITCTGGHAALGFGTDFDASDKLLDRYAAVFSKGLRSTNNQAAYRARIEAVKRDDLKYSNKLH